MVLRIQKFLTTISSYNRTVSSVGLSALAALAQLISILRILQYHFGAVSNIFYVALRDDYLHLSPIVYFNYPLGMNAESVEKEIVNWNVHTFQNLTAVVDLLRRVERKEEAREYDYKLRDFYYNPSFDIFGMKNRTSFIENAADIIRNFLSFNQLGYLQSLSFEHHMEKYKFWNELYRRPVTNRVDHEIKTQVQSIVWTYRLIPLTMFILGAMAILKASGVSKMSMRKQGVALMIAVFVSDFFVRTKKSSEIFYLIPTIEDEKLEEERVRVLNKGIVLDGKINEIEFRPGYVDELIDVADKEEDYGEKKAILEAAGFKVIDTKDYEYI